MRGLVFTPKLRAAKSIHGKGQELSSFMTYFLEPLNQGSCLVRPSALDYGCPLDSVARHPHLSRLLVAQIWQQPFSYY